MGLHMDMKDVTGDLEEDFGTVPLCMWSLLIHGTLLDSPGSIMNRLRNDGRVQSSIALVIFLIFVFFSALTLMNMLIGVLCEVVSAVSVQERDTAAVNCLKDMVLKELIAYDTDHNKMISKRELSAALENEDAARIIKQLDIGPNHLRDMQSMMYSERNEIPMEEIMEMLLFSRGDTPTTFRQMSENHLLTRFTLSSKLDAFSTKMEASMMSLVRQISKFTPPGCPGGQPPARLLDQPKPGGVRYTPLGREESV
eukprot:NODE_2662_length_896_cov_464.707491.p1 GENE.NODE_2662_length_896_cov_464.707491~~NODE_2662_length_896_cov_464.707491.p1  ORF type:complete len:254 (+),score=84.30 NODE_2662_length_896_cov_464.707491:3-764(+)